MTRACPLISWADIGPEPVLVTLTSATSNRWLNREGADPTSINSVRAMKVGHRPREKVAASLHRAEIECLLQRRHRIAHRHELMREVAFEFQVRDRLRDCAPMQ